MFKRWRAQSHWKKLSSSWYVLALLFSMSGFLLDIDIHKVIGAILLCVVTLFMAAVDEIKEVRNAGSNL